MQIRNRQDWIIATVLLGAFALLSALVHARMLVAFDNEVAEWLYRHGTVPMDWVMNVLTMTGSPELNGVMALALALELWRRTSWRSAGWVLGIFTAVTLLELVLKFWINQPGPGNFNRHVLRLEGFFEFSLPYAFPSGHALRVIFLCGIMAQWLTPRASAWWWALATTVTFSRIYLGAHWTTDVIGGVFLGAASLLLLNNRLRDIAVAHEGETAHLRQMSLS